MNKTIILLILAIFWVNIAGANVNDSTIQYLKIRQLALDPNWNSYPAQIDIITDKIGHFSYTEMYYNEDANGNPKYLTSTRYETSLTNNNFTFQINRPRNKQGLAYDFIKTHIEIDNRVVFDEWIPLNQTYRYKSFNNGVNGTTVRERTNKISPLKQGVDKNITDLSGDNQKAPGFDTFIFVAAMASIYIILKDRKR